MSCSFHGKKVAKHYFFKLFCILNVGTNAKYTKKRGKNNEK